MRWGRLNYESLQTHNCYDLANQDHLFSGSQYTMICCRNEINKYTIFNYKIDFSWPSIVVINKETDKHVEDAVSIE